MVPDENSLHRVRLTRSANADLEQLAPSMQGRVVNAIERYLKTGLFYKPLKRESANEPLKRTLRVGGVRVVFVQRPSSAGVPSGWPPLSPYCIDVVRILWRADL